LVLESYLFLILFIIFVSHAYVMISCAWRSRVCEKDLEERGGGGGGAGKLGTCYDDGGRKSPGFIYLVSAFTIEVQRLYGNLNYFKHYYF
jgi:hypothetical protein